MTMRSGHIRHPRWFRFRVHVRWFLQKRKNDLVYFLAVFGVMLLRILPVKFGVRLGGFLGGVGFTILPAERRKTLEHLRIAFSGEKRDAERREIARDCFRNLGRNLVEVVNLPRIIPHLDEVVTLEGRDHLDRALAQGRGVLWLTAHLGNWELMAAFMAQNGYRLSVIAREVYDKRLNRLLVAYREDASVNVILRDSPSAGRQMLRALKEGHILGMLIDQDTKVKGVMAPFFGKMANTPSGPASLAVRRSVPVVAGFIERKADGRHHIVIDPPLKLY